MTGIGTTKVTKETRTTTTNSSANIFPKSRKLSDKGMNGISNALNGLFDISGVEVPPLSLFGIYSNRRQNFFEYVLEFIRDVSKTQIGEEYGPWVPSCPLYPRRHTCYNGRDKGSRSRECELSLKTRPQFGLQATTRRFMDLSVREIKIRGSNHFF
ncbi:hypothetical protein GOBAR_AA28223 [Gossypium barbadense]|uniref:Uncharacterized protein n=1 Tax=Gossypium barbadense TaxID=3634 RepID=A0A2P5WMZ7_GOSBA|nr:hypothetical protein GOBAR_AA28223 [Gossypium barbadense]